MLDNVYEKQYGRLVCGVDEAGRGPLVGRVYAAAVILPESYSTDESFEHYEVYKVLNDSKKLSEKKRFELAPKICETALDYCIAYSEVSEIESMNILEASLLAMRRAISGLKIKPDFALIDGNVERGFDKIGMNVKAVVGGDGICPSIAAASILAKTERDKYCIEYLDKNYPEYGFAKHKGYGTRDHYAAIEKYGLCPEHRPSFFKKYFERRRNNG